MPARLGMAMPTSGVTISLAAVSSTPEGLGVDPIKGG